MDIGFVFVDEWQVISRVGLAFLFAFLLGYDRSQKHKPLGCQSYIIIAVTTCLLAIMSQELYADYSQKTDTFLSLDLGKVIAGTLTGIGFLGAGAIIKKDDQDVVGTATGSSIWAAGGMGLMLGYGYYMLSFIGFVTIWLTLTLIPKLLNK